MSDDIKVENATLREYDKLTRKKNALETLLSKVVDILFNNNFDSITVENYFWKVSVEYKRKKKE